MDERRYLMAGMRILIVEDNKDAAMALGMRLELRGHVVVIELSSQRVIRNARRDPTYIPDVMIVDYVLPDLNGFEMLAELEMHVSLAHTRIIFMSGYDHIVERARQRQYIVFKKPFGMEEFVRLFAAIEKSESTKVPVLD
jgi:DNA-binding response OmpR family regulator